MVAEARIAALAALEAPIAAVAAQLVQLAERQAAVLVLTVVLVVVHLETAQRLAAVAAATQDQEVPRQEAERQVKLPLPILKARILLPYQPSLN